MADAPRAQHEDTTGPAVEGISLAGRTTLRIGRAPESDLTLDDVRVSRSHAEVRRLSDGTYRLIDLGSANGTFLNGQRIKAEPIASGDFVGVGGQTLQLVGERLRLVSAQPTAWFGAVDLVVDIGRKRILDEVGFALEPASLLAVVGPSGCGKSTLLNALTGFRPADEGHVVFGGRDLYATYQDIRLRMGLVPQTDILHTQLTPRQALRYAAELRFPRDVDKATREQRVEAVMAELNLTERADLRIDRLSGGQRKRVSVGCELLTEPALLFLDEPTSGLDPGNEADLMASLGDLAHAGRTIVVVTHSVQSLQLCDRLLVLAPGGRLAYYGAPADALPYFEPFGAGENFADMFRTLEVESAADWKGRFRASPGYDALVSDPLASADLVAIPARPNIDPPPPPTPVMHQLGVLVRRYLSVIKADRGFLLALALQAPLFGLLFSFMFFFETMNTAEGLNAGILIWLIVVGATWLGTSNAIREIVKELPIYRRERAMGLSAGAYVMSKVVVLGIITILQAAVMVPLAMRNQQLPAQISDQQVQTLRQYGMSDLLEGFRIEQAGSVLPDQLLELIVVAVIVGLASLALGLLVSSIAGGVDRAATLLPVILVAQVIVSAPLLTTPSPIVQAVGYTLSAYWGMNAAASTVDLQEVRKPFLLMNHTARYGSPPKDQDLYDLPFWRHGSDWIVNIGILTALTIVALAGAWLALQATDPDLMEGRHKRSRRRWPWQRAKPSRAVAPT